MGQPSPTWPLRRIALWWVLLNLAIWWQEPLFARALQPKFISTGTGAFFTDFLQEWASTRYVLDGLPAYTSQEAAVERYLGLRRDPNDLWFIERNAHPPTSVLLAVPLGLLSYADAFLVWNLLSRVCLAGSLALLLGQLDLRLSPWDLLPALTLLLVCHPFWHQLLLGQLNLVLLPLLVGAWAAGICLAHPEGGRWSGQGQRAEGGG